MNGEWLSRLRRDHSHCIRHPPQEFGGFLGTRKGAEIPVQKSAMDRRWQMKFPTLTGNAYLMIA
jgi:hypothetical protein